MPPTWQLLGRFKYAQGWSPGRRQELCYALLEVTSLCLSCLGRAPLATPFLDPHLPLGILKQVVVPRPLALLVLGSSERLDLEFLSELGKQGCAREMFPQIRASWGGAAAAGGRDWAEKGAKFQEPWDSSLLFQAPASGAGSSGVPSEPPLKLTCQRPADATQTPVFGGPCSGELLSVTKLLRCGLDQRESGGRKQRSGRQLPSPGRERVAGEREF